MEGEAEARQEILDFSNDPRMQKMVAHVAEALIETSFAVEEHWKDDHYVRLHDFLSEPESKTIFFWVDFEDLTLNVSEQRPPSYYEQPTLVQSP